MALTIEESVLDDYQPEMSGQLKCRILDITFDSSYAGSGGEAFTPADCGFAKIMAFIAEPAAGYTFWYDRANSKLKVFAPISVAGGAAAASTDAISIKSSVVNKEAATAMSSPGAEVVAAKDLSAVVVRCVVYGLI